MKRILPLFVGAVTFLLLATVAWAQGEPAPAEEDVNSLTRIVELVFSVLTVVLPIVATWLAHRAIAVFEKKTKVNVPDAIEAKIDEWVEAGIHLAAEKSYQKVKAKTAKLNGPEKLEEAADFVFGFAQDRGWFEWTKTKIKDKVEAKLGVQRANGGVPRLEDKVVAE